MFNEWPQRNNLSATADSPSCSSPRKSNPNVAGKLCRFCLMVHTVLSNAPAIQPRGHQWYFGKLTVPEQDQLPNLVLRALSCHPSGWIPQAGQAAETNPRAQRRPCRKRSCMQRVYRKDEKAVNDLHSLTTWIGSSENPIKHAGDTSWEGWGLWRPRP